MKKSMIALVMLAALTTIGIIGSNKVYADREADGVVYVSSQGLYYDTLVLTELPPHGKFQLLVMGDNGLETEFGPGDQGYRGGRWMADFDGDGNFNYFLCPLLGPGRENP